GPVIADRLVGRANDIRPSEARPVEAARPPRDACVMRSIADLRFRCKDRKGRARLCLEKAGYRPAVDEAVRRAASRDVPNKVSAKPVRSVKVGQPAVVA